MAIYSRIVSCSRQELFNLNNELDKILIAQCNSHSGMKIAEYGGTDMFSKMISYLSFLSERPWELLILENEEQFCWLFHNICNFPQFRNNKHQNFLAHLFIVAALTQNSS